MKIAMPVWGGRISPVFDASRRLLVVALEDGQEAERYDVPLDEESLPARARRVSDLGIDVLICGGISRALSALLIDLRIEVVPWISGGSEQVLAAYLTDGLSSPRFAMPGCRMRRGQRRRRAGGFCGLGGQVN